ncbi:conserved hypothetical protein [delta proteobacterium NaphS2]|nr:conserved hypothetical protein [delta proteobacterium NaphS2]
MRKRRFLGVAILFGMVLQGPLFARDLERTPLMEQMRRDHALIAKSRKGLSRIVYFMKDNRDLISRAGRKRGESLLNERERVAHRQIWLGFLDHMFVLDRLGERWEDVRESVEEGSRKKVFYTTYAVFLAQYRFALAFIEAAEKDPALHVVLNEPVPEMGLAKGTYSDLKSRFLNPLKGADFVLLDTHYQLYGKSPPAFLSEGMAEDRKFIWRMAEGKGLDLTAGNALQHIQDFGFEAWLPIQTKVAEWMGDIKVWRVDDDLISEAQIKAMHPLLEPGDILLARREWYLSNMGLPGYWTHALLYVGNPWERQRYFKGNNKLALWTRMQGIYSGDFEQLLQFYARDAYRENRNGNAQALQHNVIESRSEGVSLSSLETAASADALVVLRPRLPKVSKAQAILRAFSYVGRPYDFNFDFLTDSEMVCTEVIYKAYEPKPSMEGLHLPLKDLLGRKLMTANDMAMVFDQEYGSQRQQLDFVLFLDGDEGEKTAYVSNLEGFRKSWHRPKWHILLPQ